MSIKFVPKVLCLDKLRYSVRDPEAALRMAEHLPVADLVDTNPLQWMHGAPVVSVDGVVEHGEERVVAIELAYDRFHERAEAYIKAIKRRVHVEVHESVRYPVAVRLRVSGTHRELLELAGRSAAELCRVQRP